MKQMKKYITLICALCLILSALAGCGSSNSDQPVAEYEFDNEMTNLGSGVVAENDLFSLNWNSERAVVTITNKKDGSVWSSTPVDYVESTGTEVLSEEPKINSLLSVTCRDDFQSYEFFSSNACVVNQRFSSEKIDNGIRVTFYFDEPQVVASVDIYLEGDAFKVKVDPTTLKSYSKLYIIKVVPAQFLCSIKNTAEGDKNSYVVLPSGSGTLLYTDARSDGAARTYSAEIYGADKSVLNYQRGSVTTPLNMGFYGIKSGESALCAIYESGAELSGVNTLVGDTATGYSYVGPYYNVRGYDNIYYDFLHRPRYTLKPEEEIEPLIVAYYPLYGEDADYVGIAKKYRNYLTEKGQLKKSQDNSLLSVRLIGSHLEDDLFLGFPTDKEVALTSYADAEKILSELSEISGGSLIANMYAYGEGGIDGLKLNGNNTLTGVVGNKKDLAKFLKFANDSSIKTFFNFDSITFAENSRGYKLNKNAAVNVIDLSAILKQYSPATSDSLSNGRLGNISRVMVSRALISKSVEDSVKTTDKYGINNIAYNTLGNHCYSDYNSDNYYPLKSKMSEQIGQIINDLRTEKSKTVLLDGALGYAAAAADIITSCPTSSEKRLAFDIDVPLYQIVFQGVKSNTTNSINIATNQRAQFLKAIETGSGLQFTLYANYSTELRKQAERYLGTSLYSDNKEKIKAYVDEAKGFLSSVAGANIKDHAYIAEDVTVTVFDNGVTVVVNHGEKDFTSEVYGAVKAQSFVTK